jgi:antitoxin component of RelBE/YafQ-DinJ toxin-antitoxin module
MRISERITNRVHILWIAQIGHMPKSSEPFIRARVPADIKAEGERILREAGLSQQQALEMFWRSIVERGGFPWEIKTKHPAE